MSTKIVFYQLVGEPNDFCRTPIIVLQANNFRSGKVLLEIEDVFHLGTAPTVDGLIVIPHDADVVMRLDQRRDDLELHLVRILILVDLDLFELLLLSRENLGKLVKQLCRQQQQIVKIDRAGCA